VISAGFSTIAMGLLLSASDGDEAPLILE